MLVNMKQVGNNVKLLRAVVEYLYSFNTLSFPMTNSVLLENGWHPSSSASETQAS